MAVSASQVKELREMTGAGMLDCKKALDATNGDFDKAIDWLREKGISKAKKKEARVAAEGLTNIYTEGDTAVILEVNSETDFVAKNDNFKELIDTIGKCLIHNEVNTLEEANKLVVDGKTIDELVIDATAKIGEKITLRRFSRITKDSNDVFGAYIHMGGKISVLSVIKGASSEVARDVSMHAAAMNPKYIKISDVPEKELEHERKVLTEEAMNEGKPKEIAEKMVAGRLKKFYKEVCLEEQPFIKDDSIDVKTYIKNSGGELISLVRYEVGEGIVKETTSFKDEVMSQVNNS